MTATHQKEELSLADRIAGFRREGYTVFKNVLSQAQSDVFRQKLLAHFEDRVRNNQKSPSLGEGQDVLSDYYIFYPEMIDQIYTPEVVQFLTSILGEQFVLMPGSSVIKGLYTPLHKDTQTPAMRGFDFVNKPDFFMVQLALYMQDNFNRDGGLRVYPKSHLKPDKTLRVRKAREAFNKSPFKKRLSKMMGKGLSRLFFNYDLPKPTGEMDIPSEAGDLIIFDFRLFHCASIPEGGKGNSFNTDKLGLFNALCGNNLYAPMYLEYLRSRADEPAYRFMTDLRDPAEADRRARALGFTAL